MYCMYCVLYCRIGLHVYIGPLYCSTEIEPRTNKMTYYMRISAQFVI